MNEIPSSISSRQLFWLWHDRATLQQKERAHHDFYQFVTRSETERLKHVAVVDNKEMWQQCAALRRFSQILRAESQAKLKNSKRLRKQSQDCLSRSQNRRASLQESSIQ